MDEIYNDQIDANGADLYGDDGSVNNSNADFYSQSNAQESDGIKAFLEDSGVNPDAIRFEDSFGKEELRNWDNISEEERFNILNSLKGNGFKTTESEQSLLQQLRDAGITPEDFYKKALSHAQELDQLKSTSASYKIDDISDDELFILDALDKYGDTNISDEELEDLLISAKNNPSLYRKTTEALRNNYRQKEDELEFEKQQQRDARIQRYQNNVLSVIQNLENNNFIPVELSADDKNDIANFILNKNSNINISDFLQDPEKLTHFSFWGLKGPDIYAAMQKHIEHAYRQGIEAGKRGNASVYINKKSNNKTAFGGNSSAMSLDVS